MKLVEDDGTDVFQKRVGQELPSQNAFRQEAQTGAFARAVVRIGPGSRPPLPGSSRVRAAILAALDRAATRRGWSTTTDGYSAESRPDRRIAGGTRVVLPDPGGATSTSDRSASRSMISGRLESIGKRVHRLLVRCL